MVSREQTVAHYDLELALLAATYKRAIAGDVESIRTAIAGASESSIIGVGSGGSFTVASLLCNLHESYTGRVSRPATSLELICNPTLASASPVFLISAEGQNPDILEALRRARWHSARPLHVITNRLAGPLVECARELGEVTTHVFEMEEKDGYLSTGSLLANAVIVARAYAELDRDPDTLPASIEGLALQSSTVEQWLLNATDFVSAAVARRNVIIVYSPLLRPVAADLESKLSEAALLHCQLADLRSFAHGRHLWLANRPNDCAVLAIIEPKLHSLWESMRKLIPEGIPSFVLPLAGAKPKDLLAGLVAEMHLISAIARQTGSDPGHPQVPTFGRNLYYLDLPNLIERPQEPSNGAENSKLAVLGARWPMARSIGPMRRALTTYREALLRQRFRAIVFDYDGTLCPSQRTEAAPPQSILDELQRLVEANVVVGIASGRGNSVPEQLQVGLPEHIWSKIWLGLYSGGWITAIGAEPATPPQTSEFLSHVTRIVNRLQQLGVPIAVIRTNHPFQVSVRFQEGRQTEDLWFVVADALRQAGLGVATLERSKHSVDVLAPGVNKSRLVAHIVREFKVDPYEVLTMGDQGAWPGNDCSLLEHRFSLSVDVPSRRLDRGWKLAPPHKRDIDATLWYLGRIQTMNDGSFAFDFPISSGGAAT